METTISYYVLQPRPSDLPERRTKNIARKRKKPVFRSNHNPRVPRGHFVSILRTIIRNTYEYVGQRRYWKHATKTIPQDVPAGKCSVCMLFGSGIIHRKLGGKERGCWFIHDSWEWKVVISSEFNYVWKPRGGISVIHVIWWRFSIRLMKCERLISCRIVLRIFRDHLGNRENVSKIKWRLDSLIITNLVWIQNINV